MIIKHYGALKMRCVNAIAVQVSPRFGSLLISSHYLLRKKPKIMGIFFSERKKNVLKKNNLYLGNMTVHFISIQKNQAPTMYKVGCYILRI